MNILWSTGDSTLLIDGLTAGLYTYTLIEAGLCTYSDTVVLSNPDSLSITQAFVQASSAMAFDGSIMVSPNGGTGPFIYAWNNGCMEATNVQLSPGTYTLTLTDGNSCIHIYEFALGISDAPLIGASEATYVYPNPAFSSVTIKSNDWLDDVIEIHVFRFDRTFCAPKIVVATDRIQIDISELTPGRYNTVIKDSSEKVKVLPFIKLAN